ncbi:MAG: DUF1841 family protein [Formosimonas sp.]
MFFNPTVAEVRQFFYHAWHKSDRNEPIAPIEQMALYWMQAHPEYHAVLNGPLEALEAAQFLPEDGQTNPFLHLSMHLSIAEQISIDQPPGIRAAAHKLAQKLDDEHAAHHAIMECLGRMLWQAQRERTEPDAHAYIEHILQLASS